MPRLGRDEEGHEEDEEGIPLVALPSGGDRRHRRRGDEPPSRGAAAATAYADAASTGGGRRAHRRRLSPSGACWRGALLLAAVLVARNALTHVSVCWNEGCVLQTPHFCCHRCASCRSIFANIHLARTARRTTARTREST